MTEVDSYVHLFTGSNARLYLRRKAFLFSISRSSAHVCSECVNAHFSLTDSQQQRGHQSVFYCPFISNTWEVGLMLFTQLSVVPSIETEKLCDFVYFNL